MGHVQLKCVSTGLCMADGIIMLRAFKIKVKKAMAVNLRNINLSLKFLLEYPILMT